jgi:CheY-like chemotaxis protein
MEAVGRLAGGVAHDFNNLLTVIRGYAEILGADLPGEADREAAEEILRASDRAAALTRQLLAFSRRQAFEMHVLDLRALVQGTEKMLRRVIGENVALDVVVPVDPAVVRADPGQVELVLMNLSVNARDAMPNGGRLSIVLKNETIDASESFAFETIPPGRYVSVSVTDTGSGMDAQTLTHLFEPFFTTKERGKGTGLGLATAFGIVKQSGGFFEVSTSLGSGSTFRILLPEAAGVAQESSASAATLEGGTDTILLVEDEPAVRDLTKKLLERHGYRVLSASDASNALSVASRHDGPIHLLLTDLVMPGHNGSGVDLARAFASLRPATAVSFMSGYSYDVLATQGIVEMEGRLLQKPFREAELLAHVRRVLDAHRPRGAVVA